MLQDNRVHDAKAELEQALSLQPSDPKGQDLLAIVYFRLGMYPRAISIYERLIAGHPDAVTPRVNLALCYLKTGLAAEARVELSKVIESNPNHSRAWGYLGLAFQRLGDYERASHAFAAGGHDAMARRLLEMTGPARALSLRPPSLAEPITTGLAPEDGDEHTAVDVDLRAEAEAPVIPGPPSLGTLSALGAPPLVALPPSVAPVGGGLLAPPSAAELARDMLIVFPRDLPVALTDGGLVLVQTHEGFATRLEFVRSMTNPSALVTTPLSRRARGRATDEPLGGSASPIVELGGRAQLVLAPTSGRKLRPIALGGEAIYLREDTVCGFDRAVAYENGRLATGEGDAVSMLQLRGEGVVIAALPEAARTVEVVEGQATLLRALSVLGWSGRVVPRPLSSTEAPAGARGYLSFTGEGMVIIDAR